MIDQFLPGEWYNDGKRTYQVIAIEDHRLIVQYQGEAEPVRRLISVQASLVQPMDGPEPAAPAAVAGRRGRAAKPKVEKTQPTLQTEITSPYVADLIRRRSAETGDYVTHEDLVALILADPQGKALVDDAIQRGNSDKPAVIAANMVDHLSARITNQTSEFTDQFDRKKIGRLWAYKPRQD